MTTTTIKLCLNFNKNYSLFELKLLHESMSDAAREIDNLAAVQAQKDTLSPIDVNGLVVRRNSLARRRTSNIGQRRRRHSLLE